MRAAAVYTCGVLLVMNVAGLAAQTPRRPPAAKPVTEKPGTRSLSDDDIARLVAQFRDDPRGPAMSALGEAGIRGLRAAAALLADPNPVVREQVGFGIGFQASGFTGAALPGGERGWLAATLLRTAAAERVSNARNGELGGAHTVGFKSLGVIPDSVEQMLRVATRAWAERFAEAVSRGEPGTSKTFGVARNPDVQTLQDSRDVFDLYGPYLQQSGDVLLRVLQDSARATPEGDLALRSAARKGVGALPDTVVAAIMIELFDGPRADWRSGGPSDSALTSLKTMAKAGKPAIDALVSLTEATSPHALALALAGAGKPSTKPVTRPALGYARDNGEKDRSAELGAIVVVLGANCLAQPNESQRVANALLALALDSTYNTVPGARRNIGREVTSHAAYESRIAALEALPLCGAAARVGITPLTALANRGDIGASEDDKALSAAAGKAIVAIQRSK